MATYTYRCTEDGSVDVTFPIGTAPAEVDCAACGRRIRRAYTPPMLSAADPTRMGLIDRTKSTADRPEVVTAIPRGGRVNSVPTPTAPPDPRLRKLPRP